MLDQIAYPAPNPRERSDRQVHTELIHLNIWHPENKLTKHRATLIQPELCRNSIDNSHETQSNFVKPNDDQLHQLLSTKLAALTCQRTLPDTKHIHPYYTALTVYTLHFYNHLYLSSANSQIIAPCAPTQPVHSSFTASTQGSVAVLRLQTSKPKYSRAFSKQIAVTSGESSKPSSGNRPRRTSLPIMLHKILRKYS